jgi:hypothetical protein
MNPTGGGGVPILPESIGISLVFITHSFQEALEPSLRFVIHLVWTDQLAQAVYGRKQQNRCFQRVSLHQPKRDYLRTAFLPAFLTFSSLATSIITLTSQVVDGVVHVISILHVDRIPVT